MFLRLFLAILALTSFLLNAAAAVPSQRVFPRGCLSAHDPSTMTQCKDRYYIFSTGQGILSKSSSDQVFWSAGAPVRTVRAGFTLLEGAEDVAH